MTGDREKPGRDAPWIMRTYSGHSSAAASNALYRANLARGQTGLSVAFDLPTQTGYDPDHPLAAGEVGKVGVPISHLGDMEALFDGIPLERMNTSMTINATAPWLFALYIAAAERQGVERAGLAGTVQNDILKEYLARGTYIFPPGPSLKLTTDLIVFAGAETPRWNPINLCSYHLQEAGATTVQEIAFTLVNAIAILDSLRDTDDLPAADFPALVGRVSFFVNAGLKLITEICKMRAFTEMWDELLATRYGVADPKLRRFRYGVQVNSLGLTEQQPENNAYRILIEMLAVVLSKDARARAIQLPAWNEALGLPREWDQQWSLRLQQIVAHETDILDFDDIFEGSVVIAAKVAELKAAAQEEIDRIADLGGAVAAIESGYTKQALVDSNARRLAAIESGEQTVIGVNAFTESSLSPLAAGQDGGFLTVEAEAEAAQLRNIAAWRKARDEAAAAAALAALRRAAAEGTNVMEPSIACAHAGVTTGEWAGTLRQVYGEYRAPTGVDDKPRGGDGLDDIRERTAALAKRLGGPVKLLIAKPGLDGHSNGAEQIALRARRCGLEVIYEGIRQTPERIVEIAKAEAPHVIGVSILSGTHTPLILDIIARLADAGLAKLPLVVGGIIPPADAEALKANGVAAIYTPKDYELTAIIADMVGMVEKRV
jgi:(2R)-ethylmalonyl-CoA mutase